jgi:hypothetical protein
MFGLMRARNCGQTAEQKRFRRLNYCGTCKALGSFYGQKTRFLLNHDTVFLAELLSAVSGEDQTTWHRSLQSYNCLNLPQNESETPVSLQFAAMANVVLTEFKMDDQIADSKSAKWKMAHKIFSKNFHKASETLRRQKFPVDELFALNDLQAEHEAQHFTTQTPDEILNFLAEPTARAVSLFFEHGAKSVEKAEFAGNFRELGGEFGKLVYLLDAFEDYEKDVRRQEFNAFRAAFGLSEIKLPVTIRRQAIAKLREIQAEINQKINDLPLLPELREIFIKRLEGNLSRKLKTDLPVLNAGQVCRPKRKMTLAVRWQQGKLIAHNLTDSLQKNWQIPVVFSLVAIIAFIAPNYVKQSKSWQECAGLSMNLMFLGAIVGTVIALPQSLWQQYFTPPPSPDEIEKMKRQQQQQQPSDGGGGDSSWCDCCGCCSDGCCECGCDSCCEGDCCCGNCCDCGDCCSCDCN